MPTTAILSIDQGTTSSRAIVFSLDGQPLASAQYEFKQYYPKNGWVEHDPEEIWETTYRACEEALAEAVEKGIEVVSIGITNQRETTLVWDKRTGKAIYNAIVWQDRRTAEICAGLQDALDTVKTKTGLLLDPYFSSTKIAWILDNVTGARALAEAGHLAFGTIDTFLIWRLTGGQSHVTDATNACRTNLYNIHNNSWDDELLALFDVPKSVLPSILDSASDFGTTAEHVFYKRIPINGVAGDQQAALFGQCCFNNGDLKSTYGTGCFALLNTGDTALPSKNKLLTTVAYRLDGKTTYALEGAIFTAGANVQWLRDGIKVIKVARETQALAESLDYDHGVFLVPGFAGLGAPHWEPKARATMFGMTRDTNNAHLARAALEAVCYQTADLLHAMKQDGAASKSVWVDGGMVANDWLCQFLADILNIEVKRPEMMESTALGAAYLAGLKQGLYKDFSEISGHKALDKAFKPKMQTETRSELLTKWQVAVQSTLHFARA
ncbi:glycerol kinase GlpK [Agaribacter flavus]|uniref:Glycerol kinase n=1 Tax=Agaribacter flavus TaxID=1902781 RepID=A0ABV7FPG2_9ALTE